MKNLPAISAICNEAKRSSKGSDSWYKFALTSVGLRTDLVENV